MAAILAWSWRPLRFEWNRDGRNASAKVAMKFVKAYVLAHLAKNLACLAVKFNRDGREASAKIATKFVMAVILAHLASLLLFAVKIKWEHKRRESTST